MFIDFFYNCIRINKKGEGGGRMALRGEISDVPIDQIFALIAGTKGTGLLHLDSDSFNVVIHFMEGNLINAEGDKSPLSSLELALGFYEGSFEFDKGEDVKPCDSQEELRKAYENREAIRAEWKKIRSVFPSNNLVIKLSDANKEEIEITGKEWKIISLLKVPTSINSLISLSPFGVFETLKVLLSLFDKGLIEISGETKEESSEADESFANIVPVRNLGYWAMKTPIEGIKAIEFYRRADDKKTIKEIAKEMGISLKEAKEIFDYLLKIDKFDKPKR